jgi:tetratricopeptide (TPR) repeat protein
MHKKFDYNLFKQGQYLLKKKQYDKALNLFKRFAKLNIKNPDGFDAIGTAYYYIKDKNKACINWKNACKLGKCENFNKFKK